LHAQLPDFVLAQLGEQFAAGQTGIFKGKVWVRLGLEQPDEHDTVCTGERNARHVVLDGLLEESSLARSQIWLKGFWPLFFSEQN
jgi:hypothetical protein